MKCFRCTWRDADVMLVTDLEELACCAECARTYSVMAREAVAIEEFRHDPQGVARRVRGW
jgi:hypothetical protein